MTLWIINLTCTHSKLSKNVYMFFVLLLVLVVYLLRVLFCFFNGQKLHLQPVVQEPNTSFCGILNELTEEAFPK